MDVGHLAKLRRFVATWDEEPCGILFMNESVDFDEDRHDQLQSTICKHVPQNRFNLVFSKFIDAEEFQGDETEHESWIFVRLNKPKHFNTCLDVVQQVEKEVGAVKSQLVYSQLDAKVLEWSIGQASNPCDHEKVSEVLSFLTDRPCPTYPITIEGLQCIDSHWTEVEDTSLGAAMVKAHWKILRKHVFETDGPVTNPIAGFDWLA